MSDRTVYIVASSATLFSAILVVKAAEMFAVENGVNRLYGIAVGITTVSLSALGWVFVGLLIVRKK